jgi:hypothetical protein
MAVNISRIVLVSGLLRAVICLLLLLAVGCGRVPVLNKIIDSDMLPEQVAGADIIVTAKLVSLEERAIIEEEFIYSYGIRYIYYDVAELGIIEVLKGDYERDVMFVKFLSFDQTQPPPNDKVDCDFFSYHDIWEPGIWLIDRGEGREPQLIVRRGNYLPLGRLGDVKRALEEKSEVAAPPK